MKFLKIELLFSISILPLVALKRWNFRNNLDINGKILAKLFTRSYFLLIWNNVKIIQQINHEIIGKACHLYYGIFYPFLWATHFSIFYHHPFYHHFYSLKIANYRMRKKKTFMATSAYYVVSKEVQNCMTRQSHFRHTCMYKKTVWAKQWDCNIASWEIKRESLTYRKNCIEEFMWGTSFLLLFCLLRHLFQMAYL